MNERTLTYIGVSFIAFSKYSVPAVVRLSATGVISESTLSHVCPRASKTQMQRYKGLTQMQRYKGLTQMQRYKGLYRCRDIKDYTDAEMQRTT